MTKRQQAEIDAAKAAKLEASLPLSDSVPRLEMEIEELLDKRRLHEGKASKGNGSGCGIALVVIGGFLLLIVEPITGGILLLVGLLVLALFSGGGEAREEIAKLDAEIKRRREKIVELKEKSI
jgi:hypothetical protein